MPTEETKESIRSLFIAQKLQYNHPFMLPTINLNSHHHRY